MAEQVRNLIAKWSAAWPSPMIISRQRDNGQFRINLVDYPEPENYEDQSEEVLETISYYLTVWMKQTEEGEIEKLAPIQLPGPYWRVYSPYTQLVQCIKFQFFATSSVTGYIGHSAIFTGLVLDSLEEDGEDIGVIPAEMWDAYKQYIEDKIIAAGVTTIDPTLSIRGAAADAKAAGDAVNELNERLDQLEQGGTGIPSEVRQALYNLLAHAVYEDYNGTADKIVIQSWAATVTAIALNQSSISINGANTYQLTATTTPSGGTVTWVSSDTSVATVSSNGLVTGIGNGTATITASSGGKKATCSVTVSGFATLTGITATYTQSGTVYDTDTLNSLKSDLVVTANYSDSTTRTLSDSDYTLSGTLEVGTSTIIVSYGGKTTTFTVNVTTVWSYDIDDLTLATGAMVGAANTANAGVALAISTTNRRSFFVDDGPVSVAIQQANQITSQTSEYYPVKVPEGATGVTASITPSTQYVAVYLYELNDGKYTSVTASGDSGYTVGSHTKTWTAAPDNYYILITTKYDNAGSSYPVEPNGLDITFAR